MNITPLADPVPIFDRDLFSTEVLIDPMPVYRQMRDIGPVVRLRDPDVFALTRFKDVQAALRSPDILVSGKGVFFNASNQERRDEPTLLTSDGDRHRRLRGRVSSQLMPSALKHHRPALREKIERQIALVRRSGWVDGVESLARHLPLHAISHMVGLPERGRSRMLHWASSGFNAIGPDRRVVAADLEATREGFQYLRDVRQEDLREGSWAASLFEAVAIGALTEGEARAALASFVFPSLDTTIYAQTSLIYNLAMNPGQWLLLKEQRELISSAVLENMRHSPVFRWFSRVAADDYKIGDIRIPSGSRVMIIYASANRDERHYVNPDRFDVTRNPQDHLGWGTGPHMCVGMHLAKLEMEVLLEALLENVERIEVGEPVMGTNQALYGIDRLPLRLH